MKALTVWQPWASLIATGAKTIETRSWGIAYRGPIAIHAALRDTQDFVDGMPGLFTEALLEALGTTDVTRLPHGAIVARAWLEAVVGPIRADQPIRALDRGGARELLFGNFSAGRYLWTFSKVIPLTDPVFCSGRLGLWTVPEDIAQAVLEVVTGEAR